MSLGGARPAPPADLLIGALFEAPAPTDGAEDGMVAAVKKRKPGILAVGDGAERGDLCLCWTVSVGEREVETERIYAVWPRELEGCLVWLGSLMDSVV